VSGTIPGGSSALGPQAAVLQKLIAERKTVQDYRQGTLPEGALTRALELASAAPNHRMTEPWRFVQVGPFVFLFVAMTRGNCVWRMPLLPDGSVGKAGQFFTSYGPSGPDGLAMDEAGRLIVCNPGLGWAWVLNERAEPVEILRSAAGASLTNVAFGGPQRKTAYFTESVTGTILRAQMASPGCAMHVGKAAKQ